MSKRKQLKKNLKNKNNSKKQNGGISPAEQADYESRGYVPVTIIAVSEASGIRADSFLTFVRPNVDFDAFGRSIQDNYAEMAPGREMLWFGGYVGNHMPDLPPRIASYEQLERVLASLGGTRLFEAGQLPPFTINLSPN